MLSLVVTVEASTKHKRLFWSLSLHLSSFFFLSQNEIWACREYLPDRNTTHNNYCIVNSLLFSIQKPIKLRWDLNRTSAKKDSETNTTTILPCYLDAIIDHFVASHSSIHYFEFKSCQNFYWRAQMLTLFMYNHSPNFSFNRINSEHAT